MVMKHIQALRAAWIEHYGIGTKKGIIDYEIKASVVGRWYFSHSSLPIHHLHHYHCIIQKQFHAFMYKHMIKHMKSW